MAISDEFMESRPESSLCCARLMSASEGSISGSADESPGAVTSSLPAYSYGGRTSGTPARIGWICVLFLEVVNPSSAYSGTYTLFSEASCVIWVFGIKAALFQSLHL